MQLNLTGKNFQITPAIKSHSEEKFNQLLNRYTPINSVHVVLHIDNMDHCAEGTLHFQGTEIHAASKASDMYVAINELVDKLSDQMHKHKEKMIDSHRQ